MRTRRVWTAVIVGALAAAGCGRTSVPDDGATTAVESAPAPAVEQGPWWSSPDDVAGGGGDAPAATTRGARQSGNQYRAGARSADLPVLLQDVEQPAIWPAADVVFATPEEAAADFVSEVLIFEGEPLLGEFQQGDARSGEIAVLFGGETGDADPPFEKGTLLLRQLGPDDGWFVIGALSEGATIESPTTGAEVPAAPLTVSGEGRGFESTLVVSAFSPGDTAAQFDQQIGAGGAFEELEPYSVTLDLSDGVPGETIVILVHGDTGLGNDPSTFAALPVVIEDVIPPTE